MKEPTPATDVFFQGDLAFMKMPGGFAVPDGFVPAKQEAKGVVMAYGETSGHAHAFRETDAVSAYYNPQSPANDNGYDEMYVVVDRPTVLFHEEHDPILVPPGIWKKWNQKEYTFEDEYRVVAD